MIDRNNPEGNSWCTNEHCGRFAQFYLTLLALSAAPARLAAHARPLPLSRSRRGASHTPAEHDSVDLWDDFEAELKARSEGRYVFSPVRAADADWLRRAEPSPEVEEALARTPDRHDSYFHHMTVPGKRCSTSADLLRTLGDALEFPGYYGMNWDALDECLRELLVVSEGGLGSYYGDRLGRRAEGLVLTVADAEHLLEKEPRRNFDTLLRILARIAGRSPDLWGGDIPLGQLFVLFSVDPTAPHGANYHLST